MSFDLVVDGARWRGHLESVLATTPGLVPVIKGNGYGFGRDLLAVEAGRLGVPQIAVGTYDEVPDALANFSGDVLVLSPWRPFHDAPSDPRLVHTVGRVEDVAALAAHAPGTRIVVEGETSLARHGVDRHQLAGVVEALGDLQVEGFAIHLPLAGRHLQEADRWAAALGASQLETSRFYVSHLDARQLAELEALRPALEIRPRIGTSLWLGDLGALDVRATVLDVHRVAKGERVGYRQKAVPKDGYLLVVAGGTSHGIGLEAPRAMGGVTDRGKAVAKGGLAATGRALSPFMVDGRQRWFVEPPHMQVSLVFLPESADAPEVGDTVNAAVRFTTAAFDRVSLS